MWWIVAWQNKVIIHTNDDNLWTEPLGTNFSELWIEMQNCYSRKMHMKVLFADYQSLFVDPQSAVYTYHIAPWYKEAGLCEATVYPKKYAHGFCFAVLCSGYTLTDFPISIRLTSLALWQSSDCPSASKATLMNMDKYFMWIHYERLHNHNKAKHNKTVCIFLGINCMYGISRYLWYA